jgi:hypothetical protein
MATDYAADLLGTPEAKPQTDYASAVLSPPGETPAGAVTGRTSQEGKRIKTKDIAFDDLEIVNKEAGVTDKTTAKFATLTKAATVDDPATKLRIFAEARFPNDPKAVERYAMIGDEVVYVGDDGKLYRDTPSGVRGWMAEAGATTLAKSPAIAGGIVGAGATVAGAPAGPLGMAAGSALGAAAGEGVRKMVAGAVFDEPQTVAGNVKDMAVEGLFSFGGSLVGSKVAGYLEKRGLARDIKKINQPAVADLERKSTAIGVELDPAQLTNLPSLKSKADVLASLPTSRDIMAEGAVKRAGQARTAAERLFAQVSTKEGLDEAGDAAKVGSIKVIDMLAKERADAARPLYDAAFERFEQFKQGILRTQKELAEAEAEVKALTAARNSALQEAGKFKTFEQTQAAAGDRFFPVPGQPRVSSRVTNFPERAAEGSAAAADAARIASERAAALRAAEEKVARLRAAGGDASTLIPEATDIMRRPSMRRFATQAVKNAADEGFDVGVPGNSLRGLHYVKLAIDDAIESGIKKGDSVRGAVQLKQDLLALMDNLSPDYAEARKVFAHYSPRVSAIKEGVVSKIAGLSDESTFKAADMIFGGNASPRTVERTRQLFEQAGLKDDWNQLTRAYLQKTFEKAGKQSMSAADGSAINQAARWRAAMAGDVSQMRIMRAAMDRPTFQAFSDMMDVFEAMGRTAGAGAGSQTMPRQEAARLLRQESGAGVVGSVAGASNPLNWGAAIKTWLEEARLGNHAEKVATIMTSPDGMKRLKDLKRLSPNDQRFIARASALFGISLAPRGADEPSQ